MASRVLRIVLGNRNNPFFITKGNKMKRLLIILISIFLFVGISFGQESKIEVYSKEKLLAVLKEIKLSPVRSDYLIKKMVGLTMNHSNPFISRMFNESRILVNVRGEYGRALPVIDHVIKLDPEWPSGYMLKAMALYALYLSGNPQPDYTIEDSIILLDKALLVTDGLFYPAFWGKCDIYMRENLVYLAIPNCKETVILNPHFVVNSTYSSVPLSKIIKQIEEDQKGNSKGILLQQYPLL